MSFNFLKFNTSLCARAPALYNAHVFCIHFKRIVRACFLAGYGPACRPQKLYAMQEIATPGTEVMGTGKGRRWGTHRETGQNRFFANFPVRTLLCSTVRGGHKCSCVNKL